MTELEPVCQNWVMVISEQHRYQGVSYKSDIIVISGLDPGDRQVLEQKFAGCDPPCLLDSSDGRFVLKGSSYNPLEVMNCLMTRRTYSVQGLPQQRTLPNIHNKDDKFALIWHMSKEVALRRANTGLLLSSSPPAQPAAASQQNCTEVAQVPRQVSGEVLNAKKLRFSPQPGKKKLQTQPLDNKNTKLKE